jgi:hypothetical protein
MDTWKITHFIEHLFHEFVLPNGPFQGYDWEQQLGGVKAMKRILLKY